MFQCINEIEPRPDVFLYFISSLTLNKVRCVPILRANVVFIVTLNLAQYADVIPDYKHARLLSRDRIATHLQRQIVAVPLMILFIIDFIIKGVATAHWVCIQASFEARIR